MSTRQYFDELAKSVGFAEAWIVGSALRGGLHILQTSHPVKSQGKLYLRKYHTEDAATWKAILQRRAVRGDECWPGGFQSSKYYQSFIQPSPLRYMAAVNLESPFLDGLAGALHVYRNAEQGDFTDADLRALTDAGKRIDKQIAEVKASRVKADCTVDRIWFHRVACPQFIFDGSLSPIYAPSLADLDSRLVELMRADLKKRLRRRAGSGVDFARVAFPELGGDKWSFHVAHYRKYPALSDGPVVFYCLEPDYCAWQRVSVADVDAESELARLLPAMQFMRDHYSRGPRLTEISRTVHLSPYHFHRRFTDVMGITPKHLLLTCQIQLAKSLLDDDEKTLARMAAICNFSHQSHFTSRFKQVTGLTPTRWRRLVRQKQFQLSLGLPPRGIIPQS